MTMNDMKTGRVFRSPTFELLMIFVFRIYGWR
jgi:hypothetical protein